jgi:hypothetical protein
LKRLYLLSPVLRNIAAAFVLANVAISFVMPRVPLRLLNAVDMSGERNAPALFSAALLLVAALLLFAVARAHAATRWSSKWALLAWLGLGSVFLYLAYDEFFEVHEGLNAVWQAKLQVTSGYLFHAWVIPAAAFLAILLGIYLCFLLWLTPALRRRFVLCGVLFVSGAVGVEIVGGHYFSTYGGARDMGYQLLVTLEEGLEMAAIVLFIHSLAPLVALSQEAFAATRTRLRTLVRELGLGLLFLLAVTLLTALAAPWLRSWDPWAVSGLVEAETLAPSTSRGTSAELVRVLPKQGEAVTLSRGSQLLFQSDSPGGQLRLTLPAEIRGERVLVVMLARHRTFGTVRCEVAGNRVGRVVDLFAPTDVIEVVAHRLGPIQLTGENVITLEIVSGRRAGIDGLHFEFPESRPR